MVLLRYCELGCDRDLVPLTFNEKEKAPILIIYRMRVFYSPPTSPLHKEGVGGRL